MRLFLCYLDARHMLFASHLNVTVYSSWTYDGAPLASPVHTVVKVMVPGGWFDLGHSRSLLAWRFLVIRTLGFCLFGAFFSFVLFVFLKRMYTLTHYLGALGLSILGSFLCSSLSNVTKYPAI